MEAVNVRELEVFRLAIDALNDACVPYVVGGAFAVYHYGGPYRNTHDLDVFVPKETVPTAVFALAQKGFADAGEMAASDRDWIYHGIMDGVMVDVIWRAPNGMETVSEGQYERGSHGTLFDQPVRFMPPDDLALSKLFTMNLHRCDWPDILHVLRAQPQGFNWAHLLNALGDAWPVLLSFVILFDWVYPSEAACIPSEIRKELLSRKAAKLDPEPGANREQMLDPWVYTRNQET